MTFKYHESLYIPYVPYEIADEYSIIKIFGDEKIGTVDSVDFIEKISTKNGKKYFQAFVHFKKWFENDDNYQLQLDIKENKQCRLYYNNDDYFILLKNRNKNKSCDNCFNVGKVYYCGNCRMAKYCSLSCQRQDWFEHKNTCRDDASASETDASASETDASACETDASACETDASASETDASASETDETEINTKINKLISRIDELTNLVNKLLNDVDKRNEDKRNEDKRNEDKRNEDKRNEDKRNEDKKQCCCCCYSCSLEKDYIAESIINSENEALSAALNHGGFIGDDEDYELINECRACMLLMKGEDIKLEKHICLDKN
jgi:hypothetical protein